VGWQATQKAEKRDAGLRNRAACPFPQPSLCAAHKPVL